MQKEPRVKSILVIDDDDRVLTALECFLETEGYETTTAWSGQEGLELLRSRRFDLLLVDDYLWDMDVETLLEEIRRMEIQPLIMLTESVPAPDDRKRYADLGASSVVGKWASCDEIAAAVRECFARKALERVLV
jgi:DNA-binding response OmpR family regulator